MHASTIKQGMLIRWRLLPPTRAAPYGATADAHGTGCGVGGMSQHGGSHDGMAGESTGSSASCIPQALGPKAPGKIRIGVAPPDAQVGQGNNAGGGLQHSDSQCDDLADERAGHRDCRARLAHRHAAAGRSATEAVRLHPVLQRGGETPRSSGFGKFVKIGGMVAQHDADGRDGAWHGRRDGRTGRGVGGLAGRPSSRR